ncbi:MAG TPA: hypothetical protein VND45_05175 [Thermoanaerobaculia bacterium]|jgi:hypothetical protein|nr:hypothetical protein [Thermoanaerobaculia bacterium]
MQSDKVVRVTLNGSGLPVPDQDPVSVKKDNQKIRWCADFDFDIRIDGYSDVHKGSGSSDCAFRVTSGTFADIKRYKYTIIANGRENDPDVDVLP